MHYWSIDTWVILIAAAILLGVRFLNITIAW